MYKIWWLYTLVQPAAILPGNLEITIVTGTSNANLLKRVLVVHGISSWMVQDWGDIGVWLSMCSLLTTMLLTMVLWCWAYNNCGSWASIISSSLVSLTQTQCKLQQQQWSTCISTLLFHSGRMSQQFHQFDADKLDIVDDDCGRHPVPLWVAKPKAIVLEELLDEVAGILKGLAQAVPCKLPKRQVEGLEYFTRHVLQRCHNQYEDTFRRQRPELVQKQLVVCDGICGLLSLWVHAVRWPNTQDSSSGMLFSSCKTESATTDASLAPSDLHILTHFYMPCIQSLPIACNTGNCWVARAYHTLNAYKGSWSWWHSVQHVSGCKDHRILFPYNRLDLWSSSAFDHRHSVVSSDGLSLYAVLII